MTEKRYDVIYEKEPRGQVVTDNGIPCTARTCCTRLNWLEEENKQLKKELQRIYEIATVNKVRDIVENVYDDLLYETSDESNYARTKVLKCLEDIDNLRDDLE